MLPFFIFHSLTRRRYSSYTPTCVHCGKPYPLGQGRESFWDRHFPALLVLGVFGGFGAVFLFFSWVIDDERHHTFVQYLGSFLQWLADTARRLW